MSASSIPSTAGDTRFKADPRFNVTALFADRETVQHAKEIHDRLKVFAQGLNPVLRLWRFDELRDANPNSSYVHLQDAARRDQLELYSNAVRIRF